MWLDCGAGERLTLHSSLSQCSVTFNLIGRAGINIATPSFCMYAVSAAPFEIESIGLVDTVHRSFHQYLGIGFHPLAFSSSAHLLMLDSDWCVLGRSLSLPQDMWPHNGWNSNMLCRLVGPTPTHVSPRARSPSRSSSLKTTFGRNSRCEDAASVSSSPHVPGLHMCSTYCWKLRNLEATLDIAPLGNGSLEPLQVKRPKKKLPKTGNHLVQLYPPFLTQAQANEVPTSQCCLAFFFMAPSFSSMDLCIATCSSMDLFPCSKTQVANTCRTLNSGFKPPKQLETHREP